MSLSAGQAAILRALGEGDKYRQRSGWRQLEHHHTGAVVPSSSANALLRRGLIEYGPDVDGWRYAYLTIDGKAALRALEQEAGG